MTRKDSKALRRGRLWVAAGMGLLVAHGGCGLDDVKVPELEGPSGLGTSLILRATPDVITADGFSTSLITATVRDQNGRGVAGRDIFFAIADATGSPPPPGSPRFVDLGSLRTSNGPGTGATVRTDSQGIAIIVYEAPARTDATANQFVLVSARPVGDDAQGIFYRQVTIELRSAEPRLFPQKPGNAPPTCLFTVQVTGKSSCTTPTTCTIPINTSVLFQSTASDPDGFIVRYFWSFGNGTNADTPDASTSYRIAGTYIVTHLVTDNNGGQQACQATITAK